MGLAIEEGRFEYGTFLNHTHEGSMGNLCTKQIAEAMQEAIKAFAFETYH